jgi:hypothetical protein
LLIFRKKTSGNFSAEKNGKIAEKMEKLRKKTSGKISAEKIPAKQF